MRGWARGDASAGFQQTGHRMRTSPLFILSTLYRAAVSV